MKIPKLKQPRWLSTVVFTTGLLGLISLAIGSTSSGIALWSLGSASVLAIFFHYLLPGSGFFSAVFANSVGIYTCLYVFFISVNFTKASPSATQAGFVLPLAGFLVGLLWHRKRIQHAMALAQRQGASGLLPGFVWILPLAAVGLMTFLAPLEHMTPTEHDAALLGAMTIISLTVLVASQSVAIFLLDMGLLFEDFFDNAAHLLKPAFAFFTWYSLLTIIFGCVYTIVDHFAPLPHFLIGGAARPITFAEGLYLSVVTLSTVGYGDIIAASPTSRLLIAAEIFSGVLLLLFGVQAVLTSRPKT